MNLSERIESCIVELDARRRQMAAFEARVRGLIDALNVQGGAPGALGEALAVLEQLLRKYGDIDASCRQMIQGLQEIGSHLDRIEDGRRKIVEGVERILSQLSQLERLADSGLVVGASGSTGEGARPKRVLLIRMRPDDRSGEGSRKRPRGRLHPDLEEEADLEIPDPDNETVH